MNVPPSAPPDPRDVGPWAGVFKTGVIASRSRSGAVLLWLSAAIWTALTLPIVTKHWHDAPGPGYRSPHLILSLFPIVGVALFIGAIRSTLQAVKFGRSMLTLTPLPPHPGEPLHVSVAIPRRLPAELDCVVSLQCVHHVPGAGAHDDSSESIAWQEDQHVRSTTDGTTTRIDADFALPADAEVTTRASSPITVIWRLIVRAQMPGIDYRQTFELPVFNR